jgi:hypothetical protein
VVEVDELEATEKKSISEESLSVSLGSEKEKLGVG